MGTRIKSWEKVLCDSIQELRDKPYSSNFNCYEFSMIIASRIRGRELMPYFRARWIDRIKIHKTITAIGIDGICDKYLVRIFNEKNKTEATRGDLVTVEAENRSPDNKTGARCDGAKGWTTGTNGLVSISSNQVRRVFKV